ncbi:DNA primase [Bryobacter aggregatus]|uniref:DNA primase n=1 Tax=Bryobacter aggregatus TaxID=360054 RepID=UPI00068E959C|nr:DNA primase [Bryobacter aggregatus]
MSNFGFKDTLKSSVDIVRTIGDYIRLQKIGGSARYRGLCPFHREKTPSFYVHADRQFYKCFGCGKGGDVFSFVMEIEGMGFYEALKLLAEKNGIEMPKQREDFDPESRKKASIQDLHEVAAKHFRDNLYASAGEPGRGYLNKRGIGQKLAEEFGLGFSDPSGGLTRLFEKQGVPGELMEQSGLCLKRNDGPGYFDRFRNRLMFPIWNESGKVIAFGGRTLGDDQPKYLNSPETPIYRKSHVLYNLHHAREGARKSGRMILVEGYMDVIGVHSAGVREVVASCGTSLTNLQVRSMKRHADRVIINFDPDNAGANAAERSIQILLEESLQIRVCSLPGGLDPDEYVKAHGAEAYLAELNRSPGYFHWLADRARSRFDMREAEGRMEAFRFLLPAIQKLPDKLERLAVVGDMAVHLRVEPGVVLDQFRKAAGDRNAAKAVQIAPQRHLPDLEKVLIRLLLHHPEALAGYCDTLLSMEGFPNLESHHILETALNMLAADGAVDFAVLQSKLSEADANLLAALFSTDTEDVEKMHGDPAAQLRACLEKLSYDQRERHRKDLRMQVREAEQRGDMPEAMRLMELERNLERAQKH